MKAEFELGVGVFTACWLAPIPCRAIENPSMKDLARDRMPADLPAPDIVQPFQFGDPAYKATGWYLEGLTPLRETNRLAEPDRLSAEWKSWNRVHRIPPGPDRARLRSRSFKGMMNAAVRQWGDEADQPVAGAHVLAKNLTQPLGYDAVEKAFRSWRATLGAEAKPYVLHGLRKLAIIRLAEAGCSDAQIQAVTGQSAEMVAYYRKRASRKALSKSAQERRQWLCCTNRVRDSSCEASVVAGMHEQTNTPDLQDQELASLASH